VIVFRIRHYWEIQKEVNGHKSGYCCIQSFIMAALHSRCGHYIVVLFLSFFFLVSFPRLISLVAGWMSTILAHKVWP